MARQESLNDSEQTIAELTKRFEREKALIVEENAKLNSDVESVSLLFYISCTSSYIDHIDSNFNCLIYS